MLTLNIGLTSPTGRNEPVAQGIRLALALSHLAPALVGWRVEQSYYTGPEGPATEHTLVCCIDYNRCHRYTDVIPLSKLAEKLDQDCIAIFNEKTMEGALLDPRAEAWGEFNLDFFKRW